MLAKLQFRHSSIDVQTDPPRQFQMTSEEADKHAEQENDVAEEIYNNM